MQVLEAVESVNEYQKTVVFNKFKNFYNGNIKDKTVAMWGLSFKPETDDMREATSLVTIKLLQDAGCAVRVYDPIAMAECRRRMGDMKDEVLGSKSGIFYSKDIYDAVLNADALLVLTEWKQFRIPSWGVVRKSMNTPLVIDGRNIYDSDDLINNGFMYYKIG